MRIKFESRGWPTAEPPKKIQNWAPAFTKNWGPLIGADGKGRQTGKKK